MGLLMKYTVHDEKDGLLLVPNDANDCLGFNDEINKQVKERKQKLFSKSLPDGWCTEETRTVLDEESGSLLLPDDANDCIGFNGELSWNK